MSFWTFPATPTLPVFRASYKGSKRVLMGTLNREPQEYSRNMMEHTDQGPYILKSLQVIVVDHLPPQSSIRICKAPKT